MVRVPRSWLPAIAHNLAMSGPARPPVVRRIQVIDIHQYVNPVTVDLGNDGVAPLAIFTAAGTAQAQIGPTGLGTSWSLDQCYLSTSVGQLDAAQCIVYVGPLAIQAYGVTGSLQGGSSQF